MSTGGASNKPRDHWADWLVRGRWHGASEPQARRWASGLRRWRDRILRDARLRVGQSVLDLGAGTGLLALGARRRVGPTGRVIALDLSHDALLACRTEAAATDDAAVLYAAVGDALRLPFRDGSFDAVLTRSVLIFVRDKPAAIRELYRVLRPGGWVSILEPINSVYDRYDTSAGMDLSAVQPAHDQIRAYLKENSRYQATMGGFDERDLVDGFIGAGFTAVRLGYELHYARDRRGARERIALLHARPNPGTPSYEEGARAVLGEAADEHLHRLANIILTQPAVKINAVAFIAARRHG